MRTASDFVLLWAALDRTVFIFPSSVKNLATMASSSLPRLLYRSFCTSAASETTTTTTTNPSLKTLVNELFDERNLKKLVEKFKKTSEHNKFRSKHRVYETTVRRLASAKRFSYIEEILEDQKKYPDMSKEGFAIRLISLYGKSGMFDHASKTFDQLPDFKCDRSVKSFNALLSACIDSKNFDKVETLFREYQSKFSITPDVYSYNILIRAFCEMGALDSALSMLDEMESNGLSPDLVTFSRLIDVLYVDGRFSDAEMIWDRMEKNNLVPDVRTMNVKVRGLIHMGRMSDAVKLVEELDSKGLKPDVHSFNALIDGFCKDGNVEEAKRFYNELLKNESIPNRLTLETLVPSLCENGEFDMALEMCMEGLNRRCYVDAWLLQVLVDGLVKESKVEEATKLVSLARLKQYGRSSLKMPDHVESK